MNKAEKEILLQAIDVYGPESQINKAIEEMAELTQALCKYLDGSTDYKNVVEEIGDVEIMVFQLKKIFNCKKPVKKSKRLKVCRLKNKLEQ